MVYRGLSYISIDVKEGTLLKLILVSEKVVLTVASLNSELRELQIYGGYKKGDSLPTKENAQISRTLEGGSEISMTVFGDIQYTPNAPPSLKVFFGKMAFYG